MQWYLGNMDGLEALGVLASFFDQIDVFMLIFVRVIGFIIAVPVLSAMGMPVLARIFFALSVSVALFLSGMVTSVEYLDAMPGYVILIGQEFLVGMLIGYVAFAVFNLIFFAGQMIDHQVGFMMVNVMDPMLNIQVPIIGNLYYLTVAALLVVMGGLHGFIGMFFLSYDVLPIGTAFIVGNAPLALYLIMLLTNTLVLGLGIALPLVGSMMIINVALGIMVKTVPQMNVFVVGIPIKILAGLLIMSLVMTPSMPFIYNQIYSMAIEAMMEVIYGMLRP